MSTLTSSCEQQGKVLAPIAQIKSGLAALIAQALQLGSLDKGQCTGGSSG